MINEEYNVELLTAKLKEKLDASEEWQIFIKTNDVEITYDGYDVGCKLRLGIKIPASKTSIHEDMRYYTRMSKRMIDNLHIPYLIADIETVFENMTHAYDDRQEMTDASHL